MEQVYIFIDESGTDSSSENLVLAIVLTENPIEIRVSIASLLDRIRRDPEIQNIKSVKESGLATFHYSEDHHEVRQQFISLLPALDFDAYVSFLSKDECEGDEKLTHILNLLQVLVYPRLQEKHYKHINIIYEQFDEGAAATKREIESRIRKSQRRVFSETGKSVQDLNLSFSDKDELCLSVPDYVAGITRDFLSTKDAHKQEEDYLEKRHYLRIAGKIRLINDYKNKKFYSRKNPLT